MLEEGILKSLYLNWLKGNKSKSQRPECSHILQIYLLPKYYVITGNICYSDDIL